jgi:zinc D-Ala-D-Ala carboxypeptidase
VITAMLQNLFIWIRRTLRPSAQAPSVPLPPKTPSTNDYALREHYGHYSLVPLKLWRWKYFTPQEVASKGDGSIQIHVETLDKADKLREMAGHALVINSWYRDLEHNRKVGGGSKSEHLNGRALDISLHNVKNPKHLYELAKLAGFTGFGFYDTFMHVDTGKPRFWGEWNRYM